MSYTKNTWETGDTITADKLNHIEDGIAAGGTLVIGGFSYDSNELSGTSDKTWQEIDNALAAGVRCVIVYTDMSGHKQLIVEQTLLNGAKYALNAGSFTAITSSADGYPVADKCSPNFPKQ